MGSNISDASEPNDRATGPVDRQSLVINAAYDLLDQGGLDSLTVRAVLKRTGLARRAFYESFEGKDDLVLALFRDTLSQAAAHFGGIARELDDPLASIRAIVLGIALTTDDPARDTSFPVDKRASAFSREHIRLAEARPQALQEALEPLLGLLSTLYAQGIATGQLRDGDPELQARLIYNLVATTVHTELIDDESSLGSRQEREVLAQSIWAFCEKAIVAD